MVRHSSSAPASRIVALSNVYDQHYHTVRGEDIPPCLSWAKRRDLFRCLELATHRELVLLSSPPKASVRRTFRWLRPVETEFGAHRQIFCGNWDGPKLRVPLSWFFYAGHVLRHTRSGDVVLVDNYELIYILAAWLIRLFRRVTFILEYEDGKHLIDRSWRRLLSGLAEWVGRGLFRGALLAHPALGKRLPATVPKELVPGFIAEARPQPPPTRERGHGMVRFLYSGSLDAPRGIPMLLQALNYLPPEGWQLAITGDGPLVSEVTRVSQQPKWHEKVAFHGSLPLEKFQALVQSCDVGLNLQNSADPISGVTFPSKIFSYLSAGLLVISSKASGVEDVCGKSCLYFSEETPEALAAIMKATISNLETARQDSDVQNLFKTFSIEGSVARLAAFMTKVGIDPHTKLAMATV